MCETSLKQYCDYRKQKIFGNRKIARSSKMHKLSNKISPI